MFTAFGHIQCSYSFCSNYIKPQDFLTMVKYLGFGLFPSMSMFRHFQISAKMFSRKKKKIGCWILPTVPIYMLRCKLCTCGCWGAGRGFNSVPEILHLWWRRGLTSDPEWNVEQPWILRNEGPLRWERKVLQVDEEKSRAAPDWFHTDVTLQGALCTRCSHTASQFPVTLYTKAQLCYKNNNNDNNGTFYWII